MGLLAQQELLEAPPARSLTVPAGHLTHWGVDPSTRAVSIATVDSELRREVRSVTFLPRLTGGARLSLIYRLTRGLAQELASTAPPGVVLIEQMSGTNVSRELQYAHGVIQAAMYDGVYAATGHGVVLTDEAPPGTWKKRACGNGAIYKPKTHETHEYGVLVWARMQGYTGSSWDEADAFGIAECSRRTVALVES